LPKLPGLAVISENVKFLLSVKLASNMKYVTVYICVWVRKIGGKKEGKKSSYFLNWKIFFLPAKKDP